MDCRKHKTGCQPPQESKRLGKHHHEDLFTHNIPSVSTPDPHRSPQYPDTQTPTTVTPKLPAHNQEPCVSSQCSRATLTLRVASSSLPPKSPTSSSVTRCMFESRRLASAEPVCAFVPFICISSLTWTNSYLLDLHFVSDQVSLDPSTPPLTSPTGESRHGPRP